MPAAPTVVICDDDRLTRQILREVAERVGYSVVAGVGTAVEALDVALVNQPDVLLLDLVMPGMSGEEIIEAIKDCCPSTQIVVHSAFDPRNAIKSGARVIVAKGQLARLEETLLRVKPVAAAG